MPTISVVGFTGHIYFDDLQLSPDSTVRDLRVAVHEVMGIDKPGLSVTLAFEAGILRDEQLIADTGMIDGSTVLATIEDIISALRSMEDLPVYTGTNVAQAACEGAWHDVVRLVEAKADLNAVYAGYSALLHLASTPHDNAAKALLDPIAAAQLMRWILMKGANPNALCSNRKNALHIWGKYGGSLEQGQVLLDYGVDVNHRRLYASLVHQELQKTHA